MRWLCFELVLFFFALDSFIYLHFFIDIQTTMGLANVSNLNIYIDDSDFTRRYCWSYRSSMVYWYIHKNRSFTLPFNVFLINLFIFLLIFVLFCFCYVCLHGRRDNKWKYTAFFFAVLSWESRERLIAKRTSRQNIWRSICLCAECASSSPLYCEFCCFGSLRAERTLNL